MEHTRTSGERRTFLKQLGMAPLPFLLPAWASAATAPQTADEKPLLNMISDGLFFSPGEYLRKLEELNNTQAIEADFYGNGGVTTELEKRMAQLTGKEKAIFLPTGTMANQLALAALSGENTKVLVPENSHIYRDEADAAQAVHGKRLVPVGTGKPYFSAKDLAETVTNHDAGEVFHSGWGALAVENPIRRADGAVIPIETIREVTASARSRGYGLHLDGARLHIASAYTGVTVAEYAALFDTVYISVYKYLNAAGGAILCGKAELIDKLRHRMKIYGGTVFQTWPSAAMALHYLDGIDARWQNIRRTGEQVFAGANKLKGVRVESVPNGSNIYRLRLDGKIDAKKWVNGLYENHGIWLGMPDEKGIIKLSVNESILRITPEEQLKAWEKVLASSRK